MWSSWHRHEGRRAAARFTAVLLALTGSLLLGGCSQIAPTAAPSTLRLPETTAVTLSGPAETSPVSLPWAVVSHPSTSTVDLVVASGGCDTFRHLSSTQTRSTLRITAVGTRVHDGDCPSYLRASHVSLPLTAAQTDVPLVHAPVARDWADFRWRPRELAELGTPSR